MKQFFLPERDCKHREGRTCLKRKKTVALDVRDEFDIKCWDRYGCDDYEAK